MSRKLRQIEYEVLRKVAVELYNTKKLPQQEIGELLGVSQSAVCNWLRLSKSGELDWTKLKNSTGVKPKLSDSEFQSVLVELEQGAEFFGFEGNYWTSARISTVIERLTGVKYDADHLSRKLRQVRWSFKNPLIKARQQNAEKVKDWKENKLEAIKKK